MRSTTGGKMEPLNDQRGVGVCDGGVTLLEACVRVRRRVTADLHEHAEAGFQQIGEAARHVLHVGTLRPVGVEDLLQELPQEGPVEGLQRRQRQQHNNQSTRRRTEAPAQFVNTDTSV